MRGKENESRRRDDNDEPNVIYMIRWQRETGVTEWDLMKMVAQVELCGQDSSEVMRLVKENMLESTDGVRNETGGVYRKAYRRWEDAQVKGMSDCLRHQIQSTRRGIREILGLTMAGYGELLKNNEILESMGGDDDDETDTNKDAMDSPLRSPSSPWLEKSSHPIGKPVSSQIAWGSHSLYDSRTAHPDLHFCTEVVTDIRCWIEQQSLH
jgi:hypothetical protein